MVIFAIEVLNYYLGIMKVIIPILFLVIAISCTTSKHTQKSTTTTDTTSQTNATITNTAVTNSTVTEVATGKIAVPSETNQVSANQDKLDKGDTITSVTLSGTIAIYKNPVTKEVTAKNVTATKTIPFNVNKTTITQKAEGGNTVTAKKETAHLKQAVKTKDKETSGLNLNYLWWLLLLLLIPIWKYRKVLLG